MTLRETIKAAVARDVRTRQAIADAAGLSRPNLVHYIAGRADLNGATLDRLMAVLGLEVTERTPLPNE